MHKLFIYLVFMVAFITLIGATPAGGHGKIGGGGGGGGKKNGGSGSSGSSSGGGGGGKKNGSGGGKTDYKENAQWLNFCKQDCRTAPGMSGQKVAIYACIKQCERNFPTEPTYGCHKGYCWSNCVATGLASEWCYTSKASYSQSYEYVKCTDDNECNKDWKCAGPCAAF